MTATTTSSTPCSWWTNGHRLIPAPRSPRRAPCSTRGSDGWQASTLSQLRKAAYIVQDGDQQVEITIIPLSAQAGSLLPNINRWRGQVGLAEVDQQQMESDLEKVTVGDVEGVYVRLQAPAGAEKQQTILGVIAVRGARSWFVKLNGDTLLADRETENFKQFVSSIQFTE